MNSKAILILSILLASFGCELRANRTTSQTAPGHLAVVLKPIEAMVHNPEASLVEVKKNSIRSRTASNDRIQHAQFVNEQNGWAGTWKVLFSTSDGGTSWRRLSFQAPDDARIESFFFVDELCGWLALTKRVYHERYGMGNSSRLFSTRDGGNTWKEAANLADEVTIKEINFFDANHGLAVGARTIDQPREQGPPYAEIAAWRTDDGGEVWTEISEGLKTTLKSETGSTGGFGRNVRWLSSTQILLLTGEGRVLNTSDRGTTWRTIVSLKDERPHGQTSSVGYYKLLLNTEKQINIIAGAVGDEGYWGDLVVNSDDKSWTSYELGLIPILDGVFLAKDEILACGMDMKFAGENQKPATVGVILHSLDHGKSWTPIYRSNITETFISLSRVGQNRFYAVSDVGTVLSFALPQVRM